MGYNSFLTKFFEPNWFPRGGTAKKVSMWPLRGETAKKVQMSPSF